jgi:hypothetical protein
MAHFEEITIDRGADVAVEVHLINADGSAKNLTNYSVSAKLKLNYNADSDNTFEFNSIIATPPSSGIVTLSLTNAETSQLLPKKRYVYDVELSFEDSDENTIIERVLEGNCYVTPSVTR